MASHDDIEAAEAYAFLRVLAPKLEQLRRRLVASNELLQAADVDTGRLTAVVETQLALKDFLSGLSNFAGLVEPIDILLGLLREETIAAESADEPQDGPPPHTPELQTAPAEAPAAGKRHDPASTQTWLRIGTASAVDKLVNAGMAASNAENFVERVYAGIGLTQSDGMPITADTIKNWLGSSNAGWRRKRLLTRKPASQQRGPAAMLEAQERVKEFALMFKRMAASDS